MLKGIFTIEYMLDKRSIYNIKNIIIGRIAP